MVKILQNRIAFTSASSFFYTEPASRMFRSGGALLQNRDDFQSGLFTFIRRFQIFSRSIGLRLVSTGCRGSLILHYRLVPFMQQIQHHSSIQLSPLPHPIAAFWLLGCIQIRICCPADIILTAQRLSQPKVGEL